MPVQVNLPVPGAHDVWGQLLNVEIEKIAAAAGTSTVAGLAGDISAQDLAAAINNYIVAPPGASAYEVWLDAGNVGTEADFLASLVGPTGIADTLSIGTVTTGAAVSSAAVDAYWGTWGYAEWDAA